MTTLDQRQEAQAFLQETLVWDNHACMPLRPEDSSFLPQLERVRAVGVDVVSLNIGFGPQSLVEHVRNLAAFRKWLGEHDEHYAMPHTLAEIDAARAAGKLSVLFDVEGLAPFDDGDHGMIDMMADLGVKWALIAYNRNNASGGGCMDEDGGLTDHGRAIVGAMEAAGMAVCCSHTGHKTARDVLSAASQPVIFSHSNASAVFAHDRNISDALIQACAETGGVIGINGIGAFLGEGDDLAGHIERHIDHMVQLVGPKHVGISLDYVFDQQELEDYLRTMRETFPDDLSLSGPLRLAGPEVLPVVVAGLRARGYGDADLAAILGGNWRRIAQDIWH